MEQQHKQTFDDVGRNNCKALRRRQTYPVLRLVGLWQEFQQADIAVKRLGDVMNAPAEPMTLIPTRANVN
jgi:ABC-type bacteriocin/lantibiotic exporter with double-glycine peptidase domain